MSYRPVGVLDSGLGGISVLKEALKLLPHENYIYYGDNANAPYGEKREDEITRLTFACADYLVSRGVKAILIACNTATATCVKQIREELDVPVVSIEPAIKPACATPGTGHVLMLATPATTRLERYLALQNSMPDPSRVINVACPGFVTLIERGVFAPDAYCELLDDYLGIFRNKTIDAIVLGCTHFPFIRDIIADYANINFTGRCEFFDGNAATARQLGRVLERGALLNDSGTAEIEFHTSGDYNKVKPLFDMLITK